MQIEVSIGNVKAIIPYNNEKEKDIFLTTSKELNIEFNKITMNIGNIDETILLSFLLFKTGTKLYNIKYKNFDENILLFMKSISKYIQQSKQNEKMNDFEKIREFNKTKELLVIINIIKKIELNKKLKELPQENNENIILINNFVEEIKNDIKNLENKILLF